jgi:predicted dehydrogenase
MAFFESNRRDFIGSIGISTGFGLVSSMATEGNTTAFHVSREKPRIRFAASGLNHNHIYPQVEAVKRGGGELVSFFAKEPELVAEFVKKHPGTMLARSEQEILEDPSIQLIVSAAIPDERAKLAIDAMQHGKDVMVDKPAVVDLQQLSDVRRVQQETRRIYSVFYSERLANRATCRAGELVRSGAIGKVVQTIGLGPHKLGISGRADWVFDKRRHGGIICDIGSHQADQFLFFTGSTSTEIVSAHVGNLYHKNLPNLEDFGEVMLKGDKGLGYFRIDWLSPQGLGSWGDGRHIIKGTEGYIELRKNIDIAGREGGDHLFLVDQKRTQYIECSKEPLRYGEQLVFDILNRTETSMSQEHCFRAMELALRAQKAAKVVELS